MNRRRFLTLPVAMVPGSGLVAIQEVRASMEIDGRTPVNFIVAAHMGAQAAERHRTSWVGKVFESRGEWYNINSERRKLPEPLAKMPGSMAFHETLFGEAAEEIDYLVGAFRREHITCIVRMKRDNEPLMLKLAENIRIQQVPSAIETAWSSAQLRQFVTDEADTGLSIEPDDSFWP